jgi:hypothetical protein
LAGAQDRKRFSSGSNSHSESGDSQSIREQVFTQLDKNPLLASKPLCKILSLPYQEHGKYVANLRTAWKYHHKNERGSKCSLHAWRGWCYLPPNMGGGIRTPALDVGWVQSKARNRWLLWRDRLGRLQWFETGRVNLYVRKPANLGKAYQLICNGFSFTGLITDMKVLEEILQGVRFKGAHYVFSVGQRLPKLTIDLFQKSNGIVIKVGDDSHPDGLEVLATYPDWAERNERLFEQLNKTLKRLVEPSAPNKFEKPDYVR